MNQVIFHNPLVVVVAEYLFTWDRLLSGLEELWQWYVFKEKKKKKQNYCCEFAIIKPLKICSNGSSTLFPIPEEYLSFIIAGFLLAPVRAQTVNRRICFTLQHRQDSLKRGLCCRKAKEGGRAFCYCWSSWHDSKALQTSGLVCRWMVYSQAQQHFGTYLKSNFFLWI